MKWICIPKWVELYWKLEKISWSQTIRIENGLVAKKISYAEKITKVVKYEKKIYLYLWNKWIFCNKFKDQGTKADIIFY